MLDWSYNFLSESEKLVLCRLSVFMGEFTLKAACAVACGAELDDVATSAAIASLVAKSLITARASQQATYYRLLELTRTYTAAKLSELGETDSVARRHAMTFCSHLQCLEAKDSDAGMLATEHAPHIGNVRAAFEGCRLPLNIGLEGALTKAGWLSAKR
jgi:predicted ATPase